MFFNFGSDGNNATEVFEFLADHTNVEYTLIGYSSSKDGTNSENYEIRSSLNIETDTRGSSRSSDLADKGLLRSSTHNHPSGYAPPSTILNTNYLTTNSTPGIDMKFAKDIDKRMKDSGTKYICSFQTYVSDNSGKYRLFNTHNSMNEGEWTNSKVSKVGGKYAIQ